MTTAGVAQIRPPCSDGTDRLIIGSTISDFMASLFLADSPPMDFLRANRHIAAMADTRPGVDGTALRLLHRLDPRQAKRRSALFIPEIAATFLSVPALRDGPRVARQRPLERSAPRKARATAESILTFGRNLG